MKKYFHVKDDEGNKFEVEEMSEQELASMDEEEVPVEETHDEDVPSFTEEEMSKIKTLLSRYDEIIALLGTTNDSDEEEEEVDEEESEEVRDEDEEEIVDTDETEKNDIKDSFGSTIKGKKKKVVDTSTDDAQIEIAKAWSQRYKEV